MQESQQFRFIINHHSDFSLESYAIRQLVSKAITAGDEIIHVLTPAAIKRRDISMSLKNAGANCSGRTATMLVIGGEHVGAAFARTKATHALASVACAGLQD